MIPDGLLTPLRTIKLVESKVDLKELQYTVCTPSFLVRTPSLDGVV